MKALLHFLVIAIGGAGIFFSWQSNERHKSQKSIYEGAVQDNKKLDIDIRGAEKERSEEEAGLAAAKSDFDEQVAKLEAAQSTEKTMQRQLAETEATLEEQSAQITAQKKLVEEAGKILGPGVTLDNIASKITEIENNKKDQTKKLEELTTLAEGATNDVAKNKATIEDLSSRKAKRDEKIARNGKEAVIIAVESDWGFVVIGAGSNTGFTPQTKMLVKRDGVLIGRLNPTSIEPSQTIAEIDRSSLAVGASLQVGDRVILAVPATQ
ncbi:MAG: hypothetical protein RLZZ553_967 [Verrucomicrobiota bacterium]|jgi:septal ring factor EnvC (AmiA/AmiB activator)